MILFLPRNLVQLRAAVTALVKVNHGRYVVRKTAIEVCDVDLDECRPLGLIVGDVGGRQGRVEQVDVLRYI